MPARDRIFARIRHNLGRGPLPETEVNALKARIEGHAPHTIPTRTAIARKKQVDLFQEKAEALAATVARVPSLEDVPEAVRDYLAAHNLSTRIKMAPDTALDGLPFDRTPMLEITRGAATPEDEVSLTPAFTGIAETGTLCMASGPETPSTLNFLPENHVVVIRKSQITGTMEDSWAQLRTKFGEGNLPRTINFISGPSRTGDIEQTLIMGAHGPRRLHILIVDDEK
ncbi:lactate utilization protein [uncultured Sneathiella sp.]|uniref:LutC/YkgG family protein n=1 Tax=uncultured Sneathiella sp. TaxID=879315 RepID=UPI0030DDBD63|tara:strand:- start:1489 stop:2169 length:681 start_codon:yes stop_codon:yes gene_type:complete